MRTEREDQGREAREAREAVAWPWVVAVEVGRSGVTHTGFQS